MNTLTEVSVESSWKATISCYLKSYYLPPSSKVEKKSTFNLRIKGDKDSFTENVIHLIIDTYVLAC